MLFKPKDKPASGPLPRASRKPRRPTPRLLKFLNLAAILLIGFAVFQVVDRDVIRSDSSPQSQNEPSALAPEVEYAGDPRIDRLVQRHEFDALSRLIPIGRPAVETQTLQAGAGPKTFCGQQVTYRILEETGRQAKPGEPQSLRLGADPRQLGLALGLLGMRAGETRSLRIPADLWTPITLGQHPAIARELKVELVALEETAPASALPLRRFLRQSGSGAYLRCGDMALLHLTIWDTGGSRLFTTEGGKPVYFVLGEGRVPFGLEQAVLEMAAGSQYSFLIPQEMLPAFAPATEPSSVPAAFDAQAWPVDLPLPADRAILTDVHYPAETPLQPPAKIAP